MGGILCSEVVGLGGREGCEVVRLGYWRRWGALNAGGCGGAGGLGVGGGGRGPLGCAAMGVEGPLRGGGAMGNSGRRGVAGCWGVALGGRVLNGGRRWVGCGVIGVGSGRDMVGAGVGVGDVTDGGRGDVGLGWGVLHYVLGLQGMVLGGNDDGGVMLRDWGVPGWVPLGRCWTCGGAGAGCWRGMGYGGVGGGVVGGRWGGGMEEGVKGGWLGGWVVGAAVEWGGRW
ncbi:hypothetical protein Tco_1506636 [Tanacetum coccineum]